MSQQLFKLVNQVLSDNYKGISGTQRENIHTHIFAKKLYCGVCGELLTAGLDAPRSDGFRPSRYTCSTNKTTRNIHSCNSFVSDILVAPFVLNYVANLIRLQDRTDAAAKRSLVDINRMLLRGSAFIDVIGVDREALQETYLMSIHGVHDAVYSTTTAEEDSSSLALEKLKKIVNDTRRHLLEDLYLYDEDEGISRKDYILKKKEITEKIERG